MQKFETHRGIAVPLQVSAVDTDQIIPAEFLKRITRHGFEDGCFANWRKDSAFVLNLLRYQGASILIAGPDFGTGSSREHAVWALQDYGFRVVIASSFGDIFRGNATKSGLLTLQLSQSVVEDLWTWVDAHQGATMEVDLEHQTLTFGNDTLPFDIDEYDKFRLIHGLDDIGITLQKLDKITEFETRRESFLPNVFSKNFD